MVFVKGLTRAETPEEMYERLSIPITECGCYAWLGHDNHGYAIMTHGRGRNRKMERVTRWLCQPVPEELEVDHLCHQSWCVNRDHLEVVTHAENIARHAAWVKKNRTHCEKHGELLRNNGRVRVCRQCKNEYQNKKRNHKYPHKGQRKLVCDDCGGLYEKIGNVTGRSGRYGCRNCGRGFPYRRVPKQRRTSKWPKTDPLTRL